MSTATVENDGVELSFSATWTAEPIPSPSEWAQTLELQQTADDLDTHGIVETVRSQLGRPGLRLRLGNPTSSDLIDAPMARLSLLSKTTRDGLRFAWSVLYVVSNARNLELRQDGEYLGTIHGILLPSGPTEATDTGCAGNSNPGQLDECSDGYDVESHGEFRNDHSPTSPRLAA
ncbi:hypothetical protein IWQ60_009265 [Tieghemiomyces parasiticus]|uniref:Uncharacterized protein n=1 Tax=Tieghemiomyces parasiticus TaxID=78921 RepID=A0A9W8DPW4_9FUNG|nr:hypothetical protein IWQ60_009265 [Tieghemiomyces parasiticus]